ncbi:MAG: energy-coupling factor ABC transporter ATP-binding protein [Candidatus Omnitrophica bacterium]|nr:energy-coupling factor ABC transporter ATP-binding protein [Candidatus Omnitrophota bacterium]
MNRDEKMIEIKDLFYKYPDGTNALEDVNLDVCKGDSVAILGPNGAGKTTLLLHMNGILSGRSGLVNICGLAVNKENLPKVREKVGLVFQDPDDQLFMPTVFDDVAFGLINMGLEPDEIRRRVSDALKLVDMADYPERTSHHLSYGEKKRISLATVLCMDPEILVMDEPTGNLDPRHRKEFICFLKDTDITKVIASHDIDMVLSICNKAAVFDKGRIVAFDTMDKIFGDKELLKNYGLD